MSLDPRRDLSLSPTIHPTGNSAKPWVNNRHDTTMPIEGGTVYVSV